MSVETVAFTDEATGPDAPEQPQEQQDRPEGLPEKFNSVEDMAKSYHELEQKLGVTSSEEGGESEVESKVEEAGEAVDQVTELIGANAFEKYSTEYFENDGKLNEDSYKELQEQYNFSPELVDAFIRGQEAVTQNEVNEVHKVVGGPEKYNEVMSWAAENLPESEIDVYNSAVEGNHLPTMKLALQGLYSKYAAENGIDPSLVMGGGKARAAGYESRQQMIDDMKKPEYREDPAFREQVERRLANTPSSVI